MGSTTNPKPLNLQFLISEQDTVWSATFSGLWAEVSPQRVSIRIPTFVSFSAQAEIVNVSEEIRRKHLRFFMKSFAKQCIDVIIFEYSS